MRLIFALVLLATTASARAEESAEKTHAAHRRFGVGWDDGIALRYRFDGAWGFGFRVNPNLSDSESDRLGNEYVPGFSTGVRIDESESHSEVYGAAILVYRESRIGRWLAIGPCFELRYAESRSETRSLNESTSEGAPPDAGYGSDYDSIRNSRIWTWRLGLRPTFTFADRFALESQFGVSVANSDSDSERSYLSRYPGYPDGTRITRRVEREKSNDWSVSVFGEELGPGATLTFIAYF